MEEVFIKIEQDEAFESVDSPSVSCRDGYIKEEPVSGMKEEQDTELLDKLYTDHEINIVVEPVVRHLKMEEIVIKIEKDEAFESGDSPSVSCRDGYIKEEPVSGMKEEQDTELLDTLYTDHEIKMDVEPVMRHLKMEEIVIKIEQDEAFESVDSPSVSCRDGYIKEEPVSAVEEEQSTELLDQLYADHEIKEEMVAGPVVRQRSETQLSCVQERDGCNTGSKRKKLNVKSKMKDKRKQTSFTNSVTNTPNPINAKIGNMSVKDKCNTPLLKKTDKVSRTCKASKTCFICYRVFGKKNHLKQHMITHTGEKPFECDVCHKKFSFKGNLGMHMLIHTGEKRFACDVCNKKFNFKATLKNHVITHTGEKPFSCDICTEVFRTKYSLDSHMGSHTGENRFPCDVCNKSFFIKSKLTIHMRTHTGEKPFACEICNKCFRQKIHLKEHVKLHTEEKAFGCDICNKRFCRKSNLTQHMRLHRGDKPFVCEVCDKRFGQRGHLKEHTNIHTFKQKTDNEEQTCFACEICKRGFNKKSNLTRHMGTHNDDGETSFVCEICNKVFIRKGSLTRHRKIHT